MHPDTALKLVQPLISGIVEDPLWSSFLSKLQGATEADYVSIVFRPLKSGPERNRVIHLYSGRPSPPLVSQLYHESLYMDDPMPYRDMADGGVYTLSDLLQLDDPQHQDYRSKLLVPSGMNVLHMMRVEEPSGISAWLMLSRVLGEFDASVRHLMTELAPYVRAALRSYIAVERERNAASLAEEAVRRMSVEWVSLDKGGHVLDYPGYQTSPMARNGLLVVGANGCLTSTNGQVARELRTAIAASLKERLPKSRAVVLSRDPWVDMLLVPSRIAPRATGPAPALVGYIHADNWSSADRCDQVCQLFSLPPSEARLSLALCRGMSIAEAAGELGITVESARTYSKRIYEKTGARGQTDLVRLIHRSVLAIV